MKPDTGRWWEKEGWPNPLVPYVIVVQALFEGRLSPTEFRWVYDPIYLNDKQKWPEDVFGPLDEIFAAEEAYVGPGAEGIAVDLESIEGAIDAEQMLAEVASSFERLRKAALASAIQGSAEDDPEVPLKPT